MRDADLPTGRYVFACDLWETVGVQAERRLHGLVWNLDADGPDERVSERLLALPARAETRTETDGAEGAHAALAQIDHAADRERLAALTEAKLRSAQIFERRLSSLDAHYQSRIRRLAEGLATATDQRIRRMRTAERANLERDYAHKRGEIEAKKQTDIVTQRVAVDLITLEGVDESVL